MSTYHGFKILTIRLIQFNYVTQNQVMFAKKYYQPLILEGHLILKQYQNNKKPQLMMEFFLRMRRIIFSQQL
ncbi:unnamed protein product [Paramecium pentaurelia]|uniref:Uncharacterized protein n=1 Tax=Paramecium pentaurelia TaxID=43138 RepID=A0A8S1WF57_9CILI|nr:unnamed protein product [Paramecium pentaurelia]